MNETIIPLGEKCCKCISQANITQIKLFAAFLLVLFSIAIIGGIILTWCESRKIRLKTKQTKQQS